MKHKRSMDKADCFEIFSKCLICRASIGREGKLVFSSLFVLLSVGFRV